MNSKNVAEKVELGSIGKSNEETPSIASIIKKLNSQIDYEKSTNNSLSRSLFSLDGLDELDEAGEEKDPGDGQIGSLEFLLSKLADESIRTYRFAQRLHRAVGEQQNQNL